MIPFLRTWILNIVTVIIFITFLELLLPNSDMKKYIKMIVGLLVMLVILNPVLELVNGKIKIENEIFKTSSLIDKKNLANNVNHFEEVNDRQLIMVYKAKIEKDVIDRIEYMSHVNVVRVHSEVDEDRTSKSFGDIKKLDIYISNNQEETEGEGIKPVSQIIVDVNRESNGGLESMNDTPLVDEIKRNISNLYSLDQSKIDINLYINKD